MGNYTFYAERPVDKYRKGDLIFIVTVLLLWGLGIFTLYICTPNTAARLFDNKYYFVIRQLLWSAGAFVGLLFFSFVPARFIRKLLPVIVLGSLFLCLLTFVPGIGLSKKGAPRWIHVGSMFTFQPSELAKLSVVFFLANLFDKDNAIDGENNDSKSFFYPLVGLLVFVVVIFFQKDFSTGLFVFTIGVAMFFVTGARLSWFLPLLMLATPAAILMITLEPFRLMRVVAFFHPEDFTLTTGYQQFASQRAITAGGIWGTGFGTGMSSVSSIPEVQADYIFAGWANSMGLVGVTAYFILICVYAWRGFCISFNCQDRFSAYTAFGFTLSIFLQSILNIAVVCGALPTTGIPLPFFSSGGSSLVLTMCMCGFIINASHCDSSEQSYNVDKKSDIEITNMDNVSEWGFENE